MIRLVCTHCKTTLEMDEAFAGGVCRCQYCGTIQTVPAYLKNQPQASQPPPVSLASSEDDTIQSLAIQAGGSSIAPALDDSEADIPAPVEPPPARSQAGLNAIASAVASSGLSGSGLRSKHQTEKEKANAGTKTGAAAVKAAGAPAAKKAKVAPAGAAKPSEKSRSFVMIIAGGVIAIVAAALIWKFALGPSRGDEKPVPGQAGVVAGGGPGFCGTPITDSSIVYLIDRGSGSKDTFGFLKEATYKSIESLGSGRKFQVIFWDNGSQPAAYPPDSLTFASRDAVESTRSATEDIYAFGESDVRPALQRAMSRSPATIVMVTAKAWQLDDSFVTTVNEVRGASGVKIYAFAIGGSGESSALKEVAAKSAGKYVEVTEADLKSFAK